MAPIETFEDLKEVLQVDDLRKMSSGKVLELAKMLQKNQLGAGLLSELLLVAPDAAATLLHALDEPVKNVVASNEKSSEQAYEGINQSKSALLKIALDPNSSEEERADAFDRIERYDDKLLEHDRDNKRFNLEVMKSHGEKIVAVAGAVAFVGIAVVSPEARKVLLKSAPKALSAAKQLMPGA